MKNKFMFSLISLLSVGVLASCGGGGIFNHDDEDEEQAKEKDDSKTQLKVAAIRSGVEDAWLQDLATRFEEKYASHSFEPGKTGVQVWVDGDKTAYNGDQLGDKIKNDEHVVYCVEGVKYNQFLNPELKVLNLKDLLSIDKSSGNEFYTDDKSILDRMDPEFRRAFEKANGDIFMIPYYESFASFQYDKDVFNHTKRTKNNASFYFKRSDLVIAGDGSYADYYADVTNANGYAPLYDGFDINDSQIDLSKIFCQNGEDASHRSLGPDGLANTFDDGLPQTFKEFELLLKVMKSAGYQPILGNSTYNYYFADMLASVWANEEGLDNMNLNFSWEGKANDLLKINGNSIVKDSDGNPVFDNSTTITKSNAKELHRQEGVYRSLELAKIISDSKPNCEKAFTAAQLLFTDTKDNTSSGYDYGLLVDGNWWENEAKNTFNPNAGDPNSRLNRNFGFFNMPKSTSAKWDATMGDVTYYNINQSTCFLNKNLETSNSNLMEAAKAFFLYINSNEGMSAFTTSTSITRPFEYTITDSDKAKISSYGKDMMKLRSYFSDKSGVTKGYNNCSTYPVSETVAANENAVHKYEWNFQVQGYTKEKANPVDIMGAKGWSPEKYFIDSYTYIKSIN